MPPITRFKTNGLGVAHFFKTHIAGYQRQYPLSPEHRKIVYNLLNCRTQYLSGQIERCDQCGAMRIACHSCRNRHCPTCQHLPRERWLAQRKREMLSILFQSASRMLSTLGENKLGGKRSFIATLHTWDQKLYTHFHLHCLVASSGAFSADGSWRPCIGLFNKHALSIVFRGRSPG